MKTELFSTVTKQERRQLSLYLRNVERSGLNFKVKILTYPKYDKPLHIPIQNNSTLRSDMVQSVATLKGYKLRVYVMVVS